MASLVEKIRTLVNANMHALVDRALETNSLKVMDEYIRQAEKNLEALADSAATVGGSSKTLKRKYEEFAAAAEKLDHDIDTLLTKGKDDLAAAAQTELNTKQQLSQEYYEQWQEQEQQYQNMLKMRLQLEAKMSTVKQEREHLRALIELAEAKKVTTRTVKSLGDLTKTGDEEINGLAEKIRERLDMEDARMEVAASNLSEDIADAVHGGEIERQLAERRKRLGVGGETAS